MVDHQLDDGVNHCVNLHGNYGLFVVNVDEGEGLINDGLIVGVSDVMELVRVYN